MKKIALTTLILLTLTCSMLLAQFTSHGTARVGYWYENEDDTWSSTGESRLNLNYYLQANSHFGFRYTDGDMNARAEVSGTGNIRFLWASYNFGSYKIILGQDETLINFRSKMNWNHEKTSIGWGAVYDGFKPMVRFDMSNGMSFALIQPAVNDVWGITQSKNVLIPKINLGYKNKFNDNMLFTGALGFNMYNYDENAGQRDESVMAFILGLMLDMDFDPMSVRIHGNFGQNTGIYGLESQTPNRAGWDGNEIVDVTTMGGFGDFSYKMDDKSLITVGASFTMSNSDAFDNADSAMAAYGQFRYQLGSKFWITPEVGMLNKMKDVNDKEEGSMLYFGTQLRMDF